MKHVLITVALGLSMVLSACGSTTSGARTDSSGVYRIRNADAVQLRMVDSMNALREAGALAPLEMNAALNAAAATHSRDMAIQNRPWHFGSDGSSPLDRVIRAGYTGSLQGENISETYESELQTLTAWMEDPATRAVILDPEARDVGFAWFQENNGKIWWTLITGAPKTTPVGTVVARPAPTGEEIPQTAG